MQESRDSINLMRLNCELINIRNSDIYSKGLHASHLNMRYWKNRLTNVYKQDGLLKGIKRIFHEVFHGVNDKKIIDYNVPFKERIVEDFLVDDYHDVGKGVVYTAIYGNYDRLQEPLFINSNIDYYAFTDQEIPKGSVWKKMDISCYTQLDGLDDYHRAKYLKMFPYEFFPNYDFSIWIDGNVKLVADTYPLAVMAEDAAIATYENPIHDCIYTEKNYMIFHKRVSPGLIEKQINDYKKDGFPEHFGMRELSIIYRKHTDQECYEIMKEWWEHVNKYTMRDQISLPFLLWKHGKNINYIKSLGGNWRLNPRFMYFAHQSLITYK